jgi:hypothetical protein
MAIGVGVRDSAGRFIKIPAEFRFSWSVSSPAGCWEFSGSRLANGYGQLRVGGRNISAHRYAAHLFLGMDLDSGSVVMHKCDNRICVNPDHLRIGTAADNNRDCADKGRYPKQQKSSCVHGHLYTPENTITSLRNGRRSRKCRICENATQRRKYRRRVQMTGEAKEFIGRWL